MFEPNEHKENYDIRKPNDKNFLFENGDEKYIDVGGISVSFETIDEKVEYFSKEGFSDVSYAYACGAGNIYFMLLRKFVSIQEYKDSTKKDEYQPFCLKR